MGSSGDPPTPAVPPASVVVPRGPGDHPGGPGGGGLPGVDRHVGGPPEQLHRGGLVSRGGPPGGDHRGGHPGGFPEEIPRRGDPGGSLSRRIVDPGDSPPDPPNSDPPGEGASPSPTVVPTTTVVGLLGGPGHPSGVVPGAPVEARLGGPGVVRKGPGPGGPPPGAQRGPSPETPANLIGTPPPGVGLIFLGSIVPLGHPGDLKVLDVFDYIEDYLDDPGSPINKFSNRFDKRHTEMDLLNTFTGHSRKIYKICLEKRLLFTNTFQIHKLTLIAVACEMRSKVHLEN